MKKLFYRLILTQLILFSLISLNIYAQDEFFTPKTTIGGYGELHFNSVKTENSESKNTLDFHRFVMFVSHGFSEKWSFKSELELEHNFVGEDKGELELEQAYIDYHLSNIFGVQAGVILPSIGILNEIHEPPTFFGVERPEYHKYIIPTTWFGNGIAFYGNYSGFDYKFSVMEGLNSDKFSAFSGIRGGRQEGFKSNANDLLYNMRINYLNIQNLLFGVSYTYNKAKGDSTEIPINLIEAHVKLHYKNLFVIGEIGNISYASGKLERSFGYYFDLGYDLSKLLNVDWQIIPFLRYSNYNPAEKTGNGISDNQNEVKKWMFGLSVKPINEIVLKIDYGERKTKNDTEITKLFNLGIGYMF